MPSSGECQWLQGGFGGEGKIQQESKHKRIPESSCSPHPHPSVVGNPERKLSKLVELKSFIGVTQILALH